MLYTKDILKYSSSEENLNRIKQIVYAIATLVKENRQSTAIKITRDDIVNIYNECKIKENEYKGTENEIEDFSRYYYKSIINELKRKKAPSFFVPKNQQTEEDEEER